MCAAEGKERGEMSLLIFLHRDTSLCTHMSLNVTYYTHSNTETPCPLSHLGVEVERMPAHRDPEGPECHAMPFSLGGSERAHAR